MIQRINKYWCNILIFDLNLLGLTNKFLIELKLKQIKLEIKQWAWLVRTEFPLCKKIMVLDPTLSWYGELCTGSFLLCFKPSDVGLFEKCKHRENSLVTQTSPEPTLLSWGGGPHQIIFPPPLATRQGRSYRANWATQTLLFSKPLDLAQVCHGNKICSKPALTWKLTLVLAFPAHCISN